MKVILEEIADNKTTFSFNVTQSQGKLKRRIVCTARGTVPGEVGDEVDIELVRAKDGKPPFMEIVVVEPSSG